MIVDEAEWLKANLIHFRILGRQTLTPEQQRAHNAFGEKALGSKRAEHKAKVNARQREERRKKCRPNCKEAAFRGAKNWPMKKTKSDSSLKKKITHSTERKETLFKESAIILI